MRRARLTQVFFYKKQESAVCGIVDASVKPAADVNKNLKSKIKQQLSSEWTLLVIPLGSSS
jgi:hypothetical protein